MKNIVIAKITSAHGIKGFVKLLSFTANPADFAKYSGKIFDAKNNSYKIKIINQIPGGNNDLFTVKIDGIEDRTKAESLRNTELSIKRTDLKKAKKDEFYYVDLIGLDVLNLEKNKIGKVLSINDFGAGGIVEIGFDDNENSTESFVFTSQTFPEVDVEKGFLVLDLPEFLEAKSE